MSEPPLVPWFMSRYIVSVSPEPGARQILDQTSNTSTREGRHTQQKIKKYQDSGMDIIMNIFGKVKAIPLFFH